MNPEELQALFANIQAARARGFSDAQIDGWLSRNHPGVSVASVQEQALEVGLHRMTPDEPGRLARTVEAARQQLAPFTQGALGSFASDVLSGLERLGVAREGETERFQSDLAQAREDHPWLSAGSQIAGGLVGAPRIVAQRAIIPASRAAAQGVGRATQAGLARMGAGAGAQLGVGGAAGTGAAMGVGGVLGAAEGAAMAAGEQSGQAEGLDRLPGLLSLPTIVGGGAGALVPGAQTAFGHFRHVGQLRRGGGTALAESAESATRGLPRRHGVDMRVEQADDVRRAAFRQFDDAGQQIPGEITDFIRTDPTARAYLRRSSSQEARRLEANFRQFEAGESQSTLTPSARLADQIRKDLAFDADAYARRMPGTRGRVPRATESDDAGRAVDALENLLAEVPGFRDGISATRLARSTERAYTLGTQLASTKRGADIAANVLGGRTVRVGVPRPVSLPNTPEAREAFRAGLLEPQLIQLRQGEKSIQGFLSDLMTGTELRDKMRVALGGEQQLQGFLREARQIEGVMNAGRFAELMIKYGGFTLLGSSVIGTAFGERLLR